MIVPVMSKTEILLDSSFNEFTYLYNKNSLFSEESWLGIDLFGNNPEKSWWSLADNPKSTF